MEKLSEDEFQSISDVIRNAKQKPTRLINSLFSTQRSAASLLKSDNIKTVKISKDARVFSSDQPCYVEQIDILGGDPSTIEKLLAVIVSKPDSSRHKINPKKINVTNADNTVSTVVRYTVRSMCQSVEVSSEGVYRKLALMKFRAYGYSISEMDDAAHLAARMHEKIAGFDAYIDQQRQKVEQAEAANIELEESRDKLNEEISELERDKEAIAVGFSRLNDAYTARTNEKNAVDAALTDVQSRLQAANNNEAQLRGQLMFLTRRLLIRKRSLEALSMIAASYQMNIKTTCWRGSDRLMCTNGFYISL